MAPYCPDDKKYAVVEAMVKEYCAMKDKGESLLGQKIVSVVTVNGVRVTLEDGTWGLVRASSNKPSLVVVVESPASEANMRAMFEDIDTRPRQHPEVGEYDQKILIALSDLVPSLCKVCASIPAPKSCGRRMHGPADFAGCGTGKRAAAGHGVGATARDRLPAGRL